jgi:hypothetical protein
MKALRLPARASPVTYLVRFRGPRDPSLLRARCSGAPGRVEGPPRARIIVQPAIQPAGAISRGREWDLSGSQAIHPVPLPRSATPAEPTIPRQWRSHRCCPCCSESKGFSVLMISGLPRGFSTCCLRFTSDVAITHARLASGWLAHLYREGVEPSGSQRKVSELRHLFPLSWIYPDATLQHFRQQSEVLRTRSTR